MSWNSSAVADPGCQIFQLYLQSLLSSSTAEQKSLGLYFVKKQTSREGDNVLF